MAVLPEHPADLLRFQRRAVRVMAWSLAVGDVALAAALPVAGRGPGLLDLALLAVAAVVHVAAALTVGRRWEPGSRIGLAYLALLVLLTAVAYHDAGSPTSDTFWFLLAPIGLSAFTNRRTRHVLTTSFAVAAYLVAAATGPGLDVSRALPRVLALVLFASVLGMLTEQLGRALQRAASARRELEEHLAEARSVNERLTELDRLKDDFVATASHELRTPLTVVMGLTQTLDLHWSRLDDEQRRELTSRIDARAQALTNIVDTMLDTARIRRGSLEATPERVMVGEAVAGALDRVQSLLADHELFVAGALDADVSADPRLLERVLDNLLTNAARHTPAGTRVHVTAERHGDQLLVAVADDGPGIPPGEVARLGEPFFRAGDADQRTRSGVGLGLALVAEVLEAMGTELSIVSEVGVGTTFSFSLPLRVPDAPSDVEPVEHETDDTAGTAPALTAGAAAPR